MWNLLLPLVTTIAGTAVATSGNNAAVRQGNAAALQGARISADATTRGAATTSDAIVCGAQISSEATRQGATYAGDQVLRGAELTADATRRGAEVTVEAIMRAAQAQAASLTQAKAEVRDGYEKSFGLLKDMQADAAPGTDYLRTTVNESQALTPAQAQQLEDLRRNVNSSIRGSQFAGSGRTAAALFKRAESDFTNTALDQNRQRAMTAATALHGTGTNAGMTLANNQVNLANTVAGLTKQGGEVQSNAISAAGKVTGDATTRSGAIYGDAYKTVGGLHGDAIARSGQIAGDATRAAGTVAGDADARVGQIYGTAYSGAGDREAQAGISNANLMGRAIGEIGSTIANSQRESRYTDRLNRIERSMGLT